MAINHDHEGRRYICGNTDESQLFESIVAFVDTVQLEKAFETQFVLGHKD